MTFPALMRQLSSLTLRIFTRLQYRCCIGVLRAKASDFIHSCVLFSICIYSLM